MWIRYSRRNKRVINTKKGYYNDVGNIFNWYNYLCYSGGIVEFILTDGSEPPIKIPITTGFSVNVLSRIIYALRHYNKSPNISTMDAGLSTVKSGKLFETFKNMFPDELNQIVGMIVPSTGTSIRINGEIEPLISINKKGAMTPIN